MSSFSGLSKSVTKQGTDNQRPYPPRLHPIKQLMAVSLYTDTHLEGLNPLRDTLICHGSLNKEKKKGVWMHHI
jgi:hypothetical protein